MNVICTDVQGQEPPDTMSAYFLNCISKDDTTVFIKLIWILFHPLSLCFFTSRLRINEWSVEGVSITIDGTPFISVQSHTVAGERKEISQRTIVG